MLISNTNINTHQCFKYKKGLSLDVPKHSQVQDISTPSAFLQTLSFSGNPIIQHKLSSDEKIKIETLIDNFDKNSEHIQQLGKGSFGIAYKISLPKRPPLVVKILNQEKQNSSYGGGKLDEEAKALGMIPKDCKRAQKLVDFFETPKRKYLISSFVPGIGLSKLNHAPNQRQFDNIVDELFKFDTNGLMNYDQNADNIHINGNQAGFIDFEFIAKQDLNKSNPKAFNDLHHINRNLYNPRLSNINAFENRTLGDIISTIRKKQGEKEVDSLIKKYLKSLSLYHKKTEGIYISQPLSVKPNPKAIQYERILAKLYANPSKEVINVEKNLIELRSITLNYYLYLIRKENKTETEMDIKTYGDFDKFLKDMKQKSKTAKLNLKKLKAENKPEIQEYYKINNLFLENFNLTTISKTYHKFSNIPEGKALHDAKTKFFQSTEPTLCDSIQNFDIIAEQTKNNAPELVRYCNNLKKYVHNIVENIYIPKIKT